MMKKRDTPRGLAEIKGTAAQEPPIDPAVRLPADVQVSIARGKSAFDNQRRPGSTGFPGCGDRMPSIITSVIDQKVQDRRDAVLDARELHTKGNRQQPPMINRLRAVTILTDRLVSDGIPFGVGPNSRMNKAVRRWLNAKAERSLDTRKSRQKKISPDAVRELLKQVRELRKLNSD